MSIFHAPMVPNASQIWMACLIVGVYLLILQQVAYAFLHPLWIGRGMDTLFLSSREKWNGSIFFSKTNYGEKKKFKQVLTFVTIASAFFIPVFFFMFAQGIHDSLWAVLAITTVVYFASLSAISDILYCKVPSGASWLSLIIAGFCILMYAITENAYGSIFEFSLALGLLTAISVTLAIFAKGNFGSGDVRFIISLASLAPWFGWSTVLTGIAAGSIVQIILRPVIRKIGKYEGKGLPFIPSLIIGTIIAAILFHTSGQSCTDLAGLVSSC